MRNTGVHYSAGRLYRLIGRDLWSAPRDRSFTEQAYVLEQSDAVGASVEGEMPRVVVRQGQIWLDEPRRGGGREETEYLAR